MQIEHKLYTYRNVAYHKPTQQSPFCYLYPSGGWQPWTMNLPMSNFQMDGPTRSVAHPNQRSMRLGQMSGFHYIHSIAPMICRRSVCLPCYIRDFFYLIDS